ncbi:MAG TPA: branched-chain amino acid ABC transporter permease, partial [Xanthobacteraceae bacterium]|nr:branched-chain amino acid ABC transporter permease [Xanthobacteraceae bacterium]
MDWLNIVLQGVLVGGLYAMFAAGLALIFGVMRLVNIAHGDLIVLAAYLALVVTETLGINPLMSLVIVVPAMAAIGYLLQRGILNQTLGPDLLPPLLV